MGDMKRAWLLGATSCLLVTACSDDETSGGSGGGAGGAGGAGGVETTEGTGGAPQWAVSLDVAYTRALLVDGDEVVLVGSFSQEAAIGSHTFTSTGSSDIFVARLDASGGVAWAQQFGGPSVEEGRAAALDSSGNIVITGWFEDTTDFGDGPLTASSSSDIFVAKLDPQGAILWSKSFPGFNSDEARALAIDEQDAIYLTGQLGSDGAAPVDFGGGPLPGASRDAFVAKLDTDGSHLMSRRFTSEDDADAFAIALGDDGSIFIAGTFSGVIDFGAGAFTAIDYEDGFLLQLDASGAHVGSLRFGGPGDDFGGGLAAAPNGDVILVGAFDQALDLVDPALEATDSSDGFIALLDGSLQTTWAVPLHGAGTTEAHRVALDGSGNVIVSGIFRELGYFGGELPIAGAGNNDVFVVKRDGGGGHLWARKIGGDSYEEQDAISIGADDAPFVAGSHRSNIDIGGELLAGESSNTQTFVAKLAP